MKYLSHIAAVVLGLLFVAFGLMFLLNLMPDQAPPPAGTPIANFMLALGSTGYMTFVKVLEVLGGVLVAIPLTRRLGLVVIGPILVNIFACQIFIMGGVYLFSGAAMPLWVITGLFLYLMWHERNILIKAVIGNHEA